MRIPIRLLGLVIYFSLAQPLQAWPRGFEPNDPGKAELSGEKKPQGPSIFDKIFKGIKAKIRATDLNMGLPTLPPDLGGDSSHRRLSTQKYPLDDLISEIESLRNKLPQDPASRKKFEETVRKIQESLKGGDEKTREAREKAIAELRSSMQDMKGSGRYGMEMQEQFESLINKIDQWSGDKNLFDRSFMDDLLRPMDSGNSAISGRMQGLLDHVKDSGDWNFSGPANLWGSWNGADFGGGYSNFLDGFGNIGSKFPTLGSPATGMGTAVLGGSFGWVVLLLLGGVGIFLLLANRRATAFEDAKANSPLYWRVPLDEMKNRDDVVNNCREFFRHFLGDRGKTLSHAEIIGEIQQQWQKEAEFGEKLKHVFEIAYYSHPEQKLSAMEIRAASQSLGGLAGHKAGKGVLFNVS